MEQIANIKFCFKIGENATKTFSFLKKRCTMRVCVYHIHVFFNGLEDFVFAKKV